MFSSALVSISHFVRDVTPLADCVFAVNPSARLPYTIARQRSDYSADVLCKSHFVQAQKKPTLTLRSADES